MWVKICGNTNLEDAALSAELGADAVGFVFAASKRQVIPAEVAAITSRLPERVERVGVFDSHAPEAIAAAASAAGLTAVQLHGGFDEGLLEELGRRLDGRVQIIQTLHWMVGGVSEPDSSAAKIEEQLGRIVQTKGLVSRVLIDSKVGSAGGGTGVAFDWAAARSLFASAPTGLRLILAGGLRPENIAEAICQLAPYGVDVSSGVEASVGRKDPQRVAEFIARARRTTLC